MNMGWPEAILTFRRDKCTLHPASNDLNYDFAPTQTEVNLLIREGPVGIALGRNNRES